MTGGGGVVAGNTPLKNPWLVSGQIKTRIFPVGCGGGGGVGDRRWKVRIVYFFKSLNMDLYFVDGRPREVAEARNLSIFNMLEGVGAAGCTHLTFRINLSFVDIYGL